MRDDTNNGCVGDYYAPGSPIVKEIEKKYYIVHTFLFVGVDRGFVSGLALGKLASLRKTAAVS